MGSAVLALVMVLTFFTPIFAEGEVDPVKQPEVVEETSSFFDHPIFKWILKFFFNPIEIVGEDPEPEMGGDDLPGEETPPSEGPLGGSGSTEGTPEPEFIPVIVTEEAVAALHVDENLEFGEIVKLLEIVENAQMTCFDIGENCEVTLKSLIDEYEDGTGMGKLFEKYGKPGNLGVGQTRKELEPKGKEKEKTNNLRTAHN